MNTSDNVPYREFLDGAPRNSGHQNVGHER